MFHFQTHILKPIKLESCLDQSFIVISKIYFISAVPTFGVPAFVPFEQSGENWDYTSENKKKKIHKPHQATINASVVAIAYNFMVINKSLFWGLILIESKLPARYIHLTNTHIACP